MGKIVSLILLALINGFIFTTSFLVPSVQAQTNCNRMLTDPPQLIENVPPLSTTVPESDRWVGFIIEPSDKSAGTTYKLVWEGGGWFGAGGKEADNLIWNQGKKALVDSGGGIPALKYGQQPLLSSGTHKYYLEKKGVGRYCNSSYTVTKDVSGGIKSCNLTFEPSSLNEQDSIRLSGNISPQDGDYQVKIVPKAPQKINLDPTTGNMSTINLGQFNPGNNNLIIQKKGSLPCTVGNCPNPPQEFYINTNCQGILRIAGVGGQGSYSQIGTPGPGGSLPVPPVKQCAYGTSFDPNINITCAKAGGLPCDLTKPSVKTAIGCIHTNPGDLMQDVLKFGIGIGGGLAFLMMLLGAFQMLTSAGNPETLAAGKDRLTSAVIGLLIIIFAVLLLQIIGFDILGIPGFGR